MKLNSPITYQDFENLLGWFSVNREQAGEKYEEIRKGLIRYFHYRGCAEPEVLADETINRVAHKLPRSNFDDRLQITSYFYSFASKVYLEELAERARKKSFDVSAELLSGEVDIQADDEKEIRFQCLEKCLSELEAEDRQLLLEYYSRDKIEKLNLRAKLADRMNLKLPTLHTRVSRLRGRLRGCIEKCLEKIL